MNKLKIRTFTMFGTHHSWAVTMRSLFGEFIEMGHDPYILSINKFSQTPKSWNKYLGRTHEEPDIDICYTAPLNFAKRFEKKSKLKLAIYNYETIPLPKMWKDSYKNLDYVLPSSNFSKEVFLEAGWPDEKCIVVPHGYNPRDFENKSEIELINDRTFRFLNVSIGHYRKNIGLLVDAYYSAFSSEDDVCLVLKTKLNPPEGKGRPHRFECNVKKQIYDVQQKHIANGRTHKSFPMLEVREDRLPSMVPLYNSCHAMVSATSSEGFGLPLLEGMAAGMTIVAPRCTGHLDFLNDSNSLLADVKKIKAGPEYQYWVVSDDSKTYLPIVESLSEKMREAYDKNEQLREEHAKGKDKILREFTWENAAKKILEIR
jgi:glycosyltransferase involved in cell wall biosynthesis